MLAVGYAPRMTNVRNKDRAMGDKRPPCSLTGLKMGELGGAAAAVMARYVAGRVEGIRDSAWVSVAGRVTVRAASSLLASVLVMVTNEVCHVVAV